jgi:hypothetical protein
MARVAIHPDYIVMNGRALLLDDVILYPLVFMLAAAQFN